MVLPQDVSGASGSDAGCPSGSWDPYEVWLTRVKQPRDRLPRRATPVTEVQGDITTPVVEAKATKPLLLRGAS